MKHLKFKILILSIFLLSVFLNISNVFASETKEIELKFSHTFINETREQKDDIYIYAVQALDGAPLPTHIESRHCNARFINPADYGYTVPADTLLFAINARDGVAGRQGGREEFKFDDIGLKLRFELTLSEDINKYIIYSWDAYNNRKENHFYTLDKFRMNLYTLEDFSVQPTGILPLVILYRTDLNASASNSGFKVDAADFYMAYERYRSGGGSRSGSDGGVVKVEIPKKVSKVEDKSDPQKTEEGTGDASRGQDDKALSTDKSAESKVSEEGLPKTGEIETAFTYIWVYGVIFMVFGMALLIFDRKKEKEEKTDE